MHLQQSLMATDLAAPGGGVTLGQLCARLLQSHRLRPPEKVADLSCQL